MPYAVTHVILTIILVDLVRDYVKGAKKYFSLHTIMIVGIAGLLPDIDIPLKWVMNFFGYNLPLLNHGGITHTPVFAFLFLIPAIIIWLKSDKKIATYFFVIAFGILFHVFLDYFLGGGAGEGVMWLWPIMDTSFKLHILFYMGLSNLPHAIDAIILLVWLWHEEAKHKILDFI